MERWRTVAGYESIYEVSDLGTVRSLTRVIRAPRGSTRVIKGRPLKATASNKGYLRITLCRDGRQCLHSVHLLVLEAFVGPRPGDALIWHACHSDGNPANNALANLRWDTAVGNWSDRGGHGTTTRGERNGRACLTDDVVMAARCDVADGLTAREAAVKYGVPVNTMKAVIYGRTWRHLPILGRKHHGNAKRP